MDEYDNGFEEMSCAQVTNAGDLEALRRLRLTVIWLLSAMADKEATYVEKNTKHDRQRVRLAGKTMRMYVRISMVGDRKREADGAQQGDRMFWSDAAQIAVGQECCAEWSMVFDEEESRWHADPDVSGYKTKWDKRPGLVLHMLRGATLYPSHSRGYRAFRLVGEEALGDGGLRPVPRDRYERILARFLRRDLFDSLWVSLRDDQYGGVTLAHEDGEVEMDARSAR